MTYKPNKMNLPNVLPHLTSDQIKLEKLEKKIKFLEIKLIQLELKSNSITEYRNSITEYLCKQIQRLDIGLDEEDVPE